MIITTNKGIGSWPGVLAGGEVLAGAILDRLFHSATVLNIQGRSYRLKDLESSRANQSQAADKSRGIPSEESRASC
jgi:DNA replication protein DnaC